MGISHERWVVTWLWNYSRNQLTMKIVVCCQNNTNTLHKCDILMVLHLLHKSFHTFKCSFKTLALTTYTAVLPCFSLNNCLTPLLSMKHSVFHLQERLQTSCSALESSSDCTLHWLTYAARCFLSSTCIYTSAVDRHWCSAAELCWMLL